MNNNTTMFINIKSFKIIREVVVFLFSFYVIKKIAIILNYNVNVALQLILSLILFFILTVFFVVFDKTDSKVTAYSFLSGILATYSLQLFNHPTKSFLWIILFFTCCAVFYKTYSNSFEKNLIISSYLTSFLLATFSFLGYQMHESSGFNIYLLLLLQYSGLFLFFSSVLLLLFDYIMQRSPADDKLVENESFSSRKSFFAFMFVIFLFWLPYFIIYYPATMSSDSFGEINQYTGISPLSNHHPIIHQLLIRLCLKLCELFFVSGSTEHITASSATYSVVQMIIMASIFSYALLFLRKKRVSRFALLLVFSFFALHSSNAFFSITMTKDVIFGGITVLLVIRLMRDTCDKTHHKRQAAILSCVSLIIICFLFCTFRNNGYYAFIIGMPVFIFINHHKWKKLTLVFLVTLILVGCYKYFLFDVMNIKKSASREALSVPMQQIARVIRDYPEELDSEEAFDLREICPELDKLGSLYEATYSNPVSLNFNSSDFDTNVKKYARAWVRLGLRHPVTYMEAFLMQNYGYWYPDVAEWTALTSIYQPNDYNVAQTEKYADVRENINEEHHLAEYQKPISVLYSIGLSVWLLIISGVVLVLKRQKEAATALLFPMTIWLSTLASPKYCEFRYIYAIIICTPVFIALAMDLPNNVKRGLITNEADNSNSMF